MKDVRSQERGVSPLRVFADKGEGVFRCGRPKFSCDKLWSFQKIQVWFVRTDKRRGL